MLSTSDIKNGLKIELEGEPYEVLDFLHSKSGRGGAFIKTKLKNLLNGAVLEHNFRSGEKFNKPDLESREMQYIYKEDNSLVFMDMNDYEQYFVPEQTLGGKGDFLKEGEQVKTVVFKDQIVDVNLAASVVLQVVETEPGVKGNTVSGATKPAKLESGASISVPLFIEEGDNIRVDTRTREYVGRG